MEQEKTNITIIGLGYVGLPLAIEFSKKFNVLGFDINKHRIEELANCQDRTKEANLVELREVITLYEKTGGEKGLSFSANSLDLKDRNIFIVTVPTPIDQYNNPDLKPLINASKMIGGVLSKGDIVIYESTVYPGCTEEICVPVLEETSGITYNVDFFCGYSPERINPGDKINTLTKIRKVTSGSTPEIAKRVNDLYSSIIAAGTHLASSIKVAEASKAIENAQRDLNVSFVNELALIFDRIGIDTNEVLEAAGTKWNFLKYKPGLVGGHCISVDPYYLVQKAESLGYHPDVILSGRRVNDSIPQFIASKTIKLMIEKGHRVKDANVLLMGVTFKENCPDIRNSKALDIYRSLTQYKVNVDIYDPWADINEVKKEFSVELVDKINNQKQYSAIIIAVAHDSFKEIDWAKYKNNNTVIFDVKAMLDKSESDARL